MRTVGFHIKDYSILVPDEAAALFLRLLPYESKYAKKAGRFENAWYYDFMEACKKHGYTSMLPRYIDPNFEDDLR